MVQAGGCPGVMWLLQPQPLWSGQAAIVTRAHGSRPSSLLFVLEPVVGWRVPRAAPIQGKQALPAWTFWRDGLKIGGRLDSWERHLEMRIPLFQDDLFGSVEDEEGDCHVVSHLGTLRGDHCALAFDFSQAADVLASG